MKRIRLSLPKQIGSNLLKLTHWRLLKRIDLRSLKRIRLSLPKQTD